ncbi:MAG: response regulator [Candidatus Auribacterota bacterium]|jgi:DNA-binding response OmpR family regulator|nr:response regulator [Candidatus Auribacterota bacterium]
METSGEKKKVLIIEDETELLTILQIRLSHAQFEVFAASDGNSGLELAQSVKPDIILLDIMMPGIDGFTILREIKGSDSTCEIPVIVVTARDRIEDSCLLEGAEGFLTKPFDYRELENAINRLVSAE